MKINYYEFPEGMNPHDMYLNGAVSLAGITRLGEGTCIDADPLISGISIKEAKRLLKEFGGNAWAHHCDRSGSVFETTAISIKGNNSRHQYNRHL